MAEHVFFDGEINRVFSDGEILDERVEFVKRAYVMKLMSLYVPSHYGEPKFEEITQGRSMRARKTKEFFSTCGELVMFQLERMGYRGKILNRTLNPEKTEYGPTKGRKYRYGANMIRIFSTSKEEGVWMPFRGGNTPNPGDCCFLSNGPPKTEHVFVFKEQFVDQKTGILMWRSYDAGQGGRITQAAKICTRKVKGRKVGGRTCHGWINIDTLPLVDPATLALPEG